MQARPCRPGVCHETRHHAELVLTDSGDLETNEVSVIFHEKPVCGIGIVARKVTIGGRVIAYCCPIGATPAPMNGMSLAIII